MTKEVRDENMLTVSRMFTALSRSTHGVQAIAEVVAEAFPWVRHLAEAERAEFAAELAEVLSDAAELGIDAPAREVIAGWRATARIKADKDLYAQALAPVFGDFGPVEAII